MPFIQPHNEHDLPQTCCKNWCHVSQNVTLSHHKNINETMAIDNVRVWWALRQATIWNPLGLVKGQCEKRQSAICGSFHGFDLQVIFLTFAKFDRFNNKFSSRNQIYGGWTNWKDGSKIWFWLLFFGLLVNCLQFWEMWSAAETQSNCVWHGQILNALFKCPHHCLGISGICCSFCLWWKWRVVTQLLLGVGANPNLHEIRVFVTSSSNNAVVLDFARNPNERILNELAWFSIQIMYRFRLEGVRKVTLAFGNVQKQQPQHDKNLLGTKSLFHCNRHSTTEHHSLKPRSVFFVETYLLLLARSLHCSSCLFLFSQQPSFSIHRNTERLFFKAQLEISHNLLPGEPQTHPSIFHIFHL